MTAPPAAPQPSDRAGGGVLRELQNAAAVKRAARQRIADAVAPPSDDTAELAEHRAAYEIATTRWVSLLRAAAHDGHPTTVIARAAGVTTASVHYRLANAPRTSDGGDVAGGQVRAQPDEPQGVPEHPSGES
jgi:hypothetical protein